MFVDICLPIYNEENILEENALKLLEFLDKKNYGFSWEIILAVNGSRDSSFSIAERLAETYPGKIRAINIKASGKGLAVKNCCLNSPSDLFVYMDIDLAVSLDDLDALLGAVLEENYDLAMGSRLLPSSKTSRSYLRELSSCLYNVLSRIILGHKFSDMQCGFKAIKTGLFKKIIPQIEDDKWFFDTELIYLAARNGFKIKEIPVSWEENRYERRKSKINIVRDGWQFTIKLLRLKFKHGF